MARLQDLEQAFVAIVRAPEVEREARLASWFAYLALNLGEVLSVGGTTRYRVSIWTDDESDAQYLRLLAQHGFDQNDPRMEQLERATTVAGWCVANRRDHYVRDITSDAIYRPRAQQSGVSKHDCGADRFRRRSRGRRSPSTRRLSMGSRTTRLRSFVASARLPARARRSPMPLQPLWPHHSS